MQPERALELLRDSDQLMDRWRLRHSGDNLSAKEVELWAYNETLLRQRAADLVISAARLAGRPEEAGRVRAFVEQAPPLNAWGAVQSNYWLTRAHLAEVEGREADALTYYQRLLQMRTKPPEPYQGRVIDSLTDDARRLWNELGGTETAWKIWSQRPASNNREQAETGWKKPDKDLPAFELSDLGGRIWRLKDLAGRAVLVNVWATWCGPCQAELPKLEDLYQKLKERRDVQILTFSIDSDPGLLGPFMKEKGYTFPVLLAENFVFGLLDIVGVPQNWIVDGKGVWRWTSGPPPSETDWEAAILRELESVR